MLNKVILFARLTRDVDLRYTREGTAVGNLGLAINRRRGEKEEVVFVDATVWGESGAKFAEYHKKGDLVYVEGRLTMDSWEDQEGKSRTKLKVTVEQWRFASDMVGATTKEKNHEEDPHF